MAVGWLLHGDEVVVAATGEKGTVLEAHWPSLVELDGAPKDPVAKEKDGEAMDVDALGKEKDAKVGPSRKVIPPTVEVQLASGEKKHFSPLALGLNGEATPALASLSDREVGDRWTEMARGALDGGIGHDAALAMEEYIDRALTKRSMEEEEEGNTREEGDGADKKPPDEGKKDGREDSGGGGSPKSVARYNYGLPVLPFRSGPMAAPLRVHMVKFSLCYNLTCFSSQLS